MEGGRKGDPQEVRDVDEGEPAEVGVNSDHRPDEGEEREHDVYRGKRVALQLELEVGKGEVKDKIEGKRERDDERQLPPPCHPEDGAE